MSRIDDLIRDLCPDGVEFRTLEEIFETRNGYTPSKNDPEAWAGNDVAWFRMDDIRSRGRILRDSTQRISTSAVKGGRIFPADSILVATSATIGEHALVRVPHLSNQRFTNLAIKDNFKESFDVKFLFYYCFKLDEWCTKNTTTSSFSSVDMKGFKKFKFPIPPLEVQHEVAKTLDQFTQLEAELEAELEARRQQYSHFANSATHSEHTITLGSVATFDYGLTAKAKNTGTHRFIRITDISPNGHLLPNNAKYVDITPDSNRFIVNDRDILVARTGASYGKTLLVRSEIPMSFASYLIRINLNPFQVDPEFYWHFTHSRDYWKQAESLVSKGGQQQFNSNALKRIKIPIPPLTQQREIAESLNHLSSLAHDLTSGLPAEIEARRKQYEYYRDRLLSFPEKK